LAIKRVQKKVQKYFLFIKRKVFFWGFPQTPAPEKKLSFLLKGKKNILSSFFVLLYGNKIAKPKKSADYFLRKYCGRIECSPASLRSAGKRHSIVKTAL
jgi:hypothetical protein